MDPEHVHIDEQTPDAHQATVAVPRRDHQRAVAAGVTDKQLATLSVWRDTELFDERQRAALRLAEIVTRSRHRRTRI